VGRGPGSRGNGDLGQAKRGEGGRGAAAWDRRHVLTWLLTTRKSLDAFEGSARSGCGVTQCIAGLITISGRVPLRLMGDWDDMLPGTEQERESERRRKENAQPEDVSLCEKCGGQMRLSDGTWLHTVNGSADCDDVTNWFYNPQRYPNWLRRWGPGR